MLSSSIQHFQSSMEKAIQSAAASNMSVVQDMVSVHQTAFSNPTSYNAVEHFKAVQGVLQTVLASQQAFMANVGTAIGVYLRESTSEVQGSFNKAGMAQVADAVSDAVDIAQDTAEVVQRAVDVINKRVSKAPVRKTSHK